MIQELRPAISSFHLSLPVICAGKKRELDWRHWLVPSACEDTVSKNWKPEAALQKEDSVHAPRTQMLS